HRVARLLVRAAAGPDGNPGGRYLAVARGHRARVAARPVGGALHANVPLARARAAAPVARRLAADPRSLARHAAAPVRDAGGGRARALCEDAGALVSGLTKLTMAGRMPRRWSAELEHGSSHPSLARRLHAIRRVAAIPVMPFDATLVIATTRPTALVVLDRDG